ncbi:MAG: DUF2779 domain-containing protein [Chloroflexi bacterium]|nr:DUF2779 domain-containing protein [Chloroflexota bacterium]
MASTQTPTLSKSRFGAGLQCLKRLYLEVYQPELAEEPDAGQQALFEAGNRVGALARKLFPGGRLVEEAYDRHEQAVTATARALAEASLPAIFEAAFTFQGIRIRCDILRRNVDGSFDLMEVKSSARVKEEHIPDVSIQLHVVEGVGLHIQAAYVSHINSGYVYQGGEYDLASLFQQDDVTDQAREFLATVAPGKLAEMWEALYQERVPAIEIGSHCQRPYHCSFYGHCHQGLREYYIEQLPYVRAEMLETLRDAGILDIRHIPADFPKLTLMQRRVRDSTISGAPFVSGGLGKALAQVRPPLHFLDFETVNPALPLFPGTRPFQSIPFQWSLHTLDSGGKLYHQAFLHQGKDDPRKAFTQSLLQAARGPGPILVYSTFEATRLKEAAEHLPQYADGLTAMQGRLFDLLKLLREHYYHPAQHGSYSLKSVLPALAPDMGYDDLAIQEGNAAALAYEKMLALETPEGERAVLRQALLDYCQRDTLAMVKVVEALCKEADQRLS